MFAPGVPPALLVDFAKLVAAEDSATHLLPSTVYAKALALFDRALTKCKAKVASAYLSFEFNARDNFCCDVFSLVRFHSG